MTNLTAEQKKELLPILQFMGYVESDTEVVELFGIIEALLRKSREETVEKIIRKVKRVRHTRIYHIEGDVVEDLWNNAIEAVLEKLRTLDKIKDGEE